MNCGMPKQSGFTLLELLIILVIIGIMASIAMPLAKASSKRAHEIELRSHLNAIRSAIDAFKSAWDRDGDVLLGPLCIQNIPACKEVSGVSGYPKSLNVLLGVTLTGNEAPFRTIKKPYLRSIPADPMTGKADWKLRCYADPADAARWCGDDVYDLTSTSPDTALDGAKYRDW